MIHSTYYLINVSSIKTYILVCNRWMAITEKRFIRGHIGAKFVCAHIPGNTTDRNELTPQTEHPYPKIPFPRHRAVPRHFCTHPLPQVSKPTASKSHCDSPCWSASLCTLSLIFFTGNKDDSDPTLQLCWLRGPATFSHVLKPLHVYCGREALGAVPLCHKHD